jgi:hypothetical protein
LTGYHRHSGSSKNWRVPLLISFLLMPKRRRGLKNGGPVLYIVTHFGDYHLFFGEPMEINVHILM